MCSALYKKMKLEDILNDKSTGFDRKIPTLVTVWLRVKELLENSQKKCIDKVIEWAQSHTLNLVLHGDWTSQSEQLKERLCKAVEDFDNALVDYENLTSRRCKKLIEVIRDPWGDKTLCKILNNPDKCTKEEELTYFSSEHGYLVAMRLKKLCDSHCEDLALRFANACLRCLRMPESQNFLVVTTEDQKRYILDIYIALLHKYKRTHDIINELKHLTLDEGLQLVQRFTNKRVELSRVWKHCSRIAELAAQFFMTAAMTKPVNEIESILTELLNAWVVLNDKLEGLATIPTIIRRIIQTADSAAHIFICCEVLHKKFGDKIKSFTIELYIRALTTDMNEMEKQKTHSETEKVDETSKRLSEGFLSLADLLQDHLGVSRECVLTSFSLNPTRSCMERIEKLAIACGKAPNPEEIEIKRECLEIAEDLSQKSLNFPPKVDNSLSLLDTGQNSQYLWSTSPINERTLDALILIKGDAVTGSKNYDVLSAPNQVLDASALGLSDQLCDDLAVVLSSPRYQMLSWVLDWNELKSTCDKYLSNAEGTRHTVKELKYLNIDYNQFKDWPCDERQQYGGIEKGYEQWADEGNSNSVVEYPLIYNDSDSSCAAGRGRRRRKTVQRIYSSESEYESVERKVDSHGSDIDTASQDADSLGSDGLLHVSKKAKKSSSPNLPHFAVIMNPHNQANSTSDFGSDEMLSIFARLDTPEKTLSISKPSYANPNLQPFMLPEKRSSDPQVLRNLRMYRTKKRLPDMDSSLPNGIINELNPTETLSKLKDMPHMNPRVLLDRHDFDNFSNKSLLKSAVKHNLDNLVNKRHSDHKTFSKCHFNKLNMNPRVLLDRYEDIKSFYKTTKYIDKNHSLSDCIDDRKKRKLDLLDNVPGMNSLDMIQPALVQPTVQVVQLSSSQIGNQQMRTVKTSTTSSNVTSTITSSITSTPVTAHIQRVGQPRPQENKVSRTEETEIDNTSTPVSVLSNISEIQTSTSPAVTTVNVIVSDTPPSTVTKSVVTQSSQSTPTLVNILSQQIIRPAQANTSTSRSPTLINILSQQIIRPPLPQSVPIVCVSTSSLQNSMHSNSTSVTTTITQAQSNLKLVTTNSSQNQIFQQLFSSQGKNNNQVLKNVNLVTGITNTQSSVDTSRLVQFLCKTDGKIVQLTPYSANSNIKLQTFDSSKLVKTATSTISGSKQVTTQSTSSPVSPPISARSDYEQTYAKFIQIAGKNIPAKTVTKENSTSSESSSSSEQANSLPKFQQAFGKPVYQNSSTVDPAANLPTIGINSTSTVSLHTATLTSTQTTFTSTSTNTITVCPQLTNLQLTNTSTIGKSSNTSTAAAASVATIPVVGTSKTTVPPLGVQAIQGGVIYTRQVPVSLAVSAGQTINLISNAAVSQSSVGRNQVFRITSATGDQVNLVKDTVIRSKMSALLAAALQSGVPNRCVSTSTVTGITTTTTAVSNLSPSTDSTVTFTQSQQQDAVVESEVCEVDSSSNDSCHTNTNSNTTSTLVTPMRITLPMMQRTPGPNGMQGARVVRPVLQIPGTMIRGATAVRQQVVLASAQAVPIGTSSTRTPQTQSITIGDNILTHNSMEPLLSSTTLEQLREFDLVLEQVKERSTVQPTSTQTTPRTQVQTQAQVEKPTTNANQTSSSSSSSDLQEVISGVQYINQGQITQKVSPCTSVVVVTSYCNIQPAASPALSVTSQSSSSPCVTPAPSASGSIGKTVSKTTAKNPKSKTVKTTTTHTSKASPVPKPQQKPQEDEQTTQRIFDILAEYAEQLRNSPDLNNKPAPRRRSNPPTNPSQNSKRKKNSGAKKSVSSHCNSMASDLSPGADDPRTIGSEDSSCGVVQISVQDSPSQGAPSTEDHQSTQGSSDFSSIRNQQTESSDTTTEVIENQLSTSGRQFIFTDSNTNQSRNVIIADSTVNEALGKISNTAAVIVPANYIAVVSGNSKILATVPARSGSNMLLFQSFVNQARKPVAGQANVKSMKFSTLQSIQGITSQTLTGINTQSSVVLPSGSDTASLAQTLTLKKTNSGNTIENKVLSTTGELLLNIGSANDIKPITSQTSEVTFGSLIKTEEISHSESPIPSHIIKTENDVESVVNQMDQSLKVLRSDTICSEDNKVEVKIEEKPDIVSSNTATFSLNFATKSSPTVSVIEKNVSNIQESSSPKKIGVSCLPALGEKSQHTVVRTVIESQSTAKSIAASSNIAFSQMESVDHFTKVYVGEKKSQTNTNGPMLGQSESGVNRDVIVTESSKDNIHEKDDSTTMSAPYNKPKKLQTTQRTEKELQQVQQRKQAAVERELQLQKSLSEECEDLGVDEPSTSDLFPEADLLFDSNNSPSFDQLSQDADKRYTTENFQIESPCSSTDEEYKQTTKDTKNGDTFLAEPHGSNSTVIKKERPDIGNISCKVDESPSVSEEHDAEHRSSEAIPNLTSNDKGKPTITLFSDEDNSNSNLFGSLGYPSGEVEFEYDERPKIRQMTNCNKDGITLQSSTSLSVYNDEHTNLTTYASITEVFSPIHYDVHSPPPIHKYKFKYCNRKKLMNLQNAPASKSPEKMENSWHHNSDVVEILSSDDVSTDSTTTERAKSSASGSPSPTSSVRKRTTSPAWDEEDDEHDDEDSSNPSYKSIYNTNKILKLSMGKLVEPITCANQQKSSDKIRKNSVTECTLDSSVVNTTPPSPLSPSDGELGSFSIGRGTRRSTQRIKKNCPCCTSPDKPKKRTTPGSNIKKLAAKGQFNKKR